MGQVGTSGTGTSSIVGIELDGSRRRGFRRGTSLVGTQVSQDRRTKCDDKYTVSQQREALSTKMNTGKFSGLRAETPARCYT